MTMRVLYIQADCMGTRLWCAFSVPCTSLPVVAVAVSHIWSCLTCTYRPLSRIKKGNKSHKLRCVRGTFFNLLYHNTIYNPQRHIFTPSNEIRRMYHISAHPEITRIRAQQVVLLCFPVNAAAASRVGYRRNQSHAQLSTRDTYILFPLTLASISRISSTWTQRVEDAYTPPRFRLSALMNSLFVCGIRGVKFSPG